MSAVGPTCAAIVKFGGAALTDKRQQERLNIEGFASCIKLASQLPSHSCIVHGAGSFGHFHASLYNIKAGTAASSSNLGPGAHLGMCETRRSVLKLNSMVSSALLDAKRCATPVHPMDSWVSDDTVLASADLTCVQRCLQLDVLPVLHGDVIFDSRRGYTVLSGDDIMQELSRRLQPPLVLFVSDVPGVFLEPPACASTASTKDPSFISLCIVDSSGCIQRLQHLESQHHELASLEVGGSSGTDITGGALSRLFLTNFADAHRQVCGKNYKAHARSRRQGFPLLYAAPTFRLFLRPSVHVPGAFSKHALKQTFAQFSDFLLIAFRILRDGMGVPSAAIQLAV